LPPALASLLSKFVVGGISASLMSHTIGAPPIARAARPEVKARVLPEALSGRKISALAITEPSGGSDVANLRTKRGATAIITSSAARRPSSPRACAPTI
jgi:alkylation response protein AidB-like acyl-CoA dehydrogenase